MRKSDVPNVLVDESKEFYLPLLAQSVERETLIEIISRLRVRPPREATGKPLFVAPARGNVFMYASSLVTRQIECPILLDGVGPRDTVIGWDPRVVKVNCPLLSAPAIGYEEIAYC